MTAGEATYHVRGKEVGLMVRAVVSALFEELSCWDVVRDASGLRVRLERRVDPPSTEDLVRPHP